MVGGMSCCDTTASQASAVFGTCCKHTCGRSLQHTLGAHTRPNSNDKVRVCMTWKVRSGKQLGPQSPPPRGPSVTHLHGPVVDVVSLRVLCKPGIFLEQHVLDPCMQWRLPL
jgi:hypothetical protein